LLSSIKNWGHRVEMVTNLLTKDTRRRKQVRVLAILSVGLSLIVFSPIIRLGIGELLPRDPIRLGVVGVFVPKKWMLSRAYNRVAVWKPCNTILCGSSPRASFTIEISALPANSGDVWERAAINTIRKNYSAEANARTIDGSSGPLKCVELEAATADGKAVTSCLSSNLGLTATFVGEPVLKPVFYAVLTSARKTP